MVEVAVIGAGITGLVCARQLRQAGYQVVIVEKSRGVGGRLATRRVADSCADHGARYLEPHSDRLARLMQMLSDRQIIQPWTDTIYSLGVHPELQTPAPEQIYPRYVAPAGMTAVARFLATDLEIHYSQRVDAIALTNESSWQLSLTPTDNSSSDATPGLLEAGAIVCTIPAPQALALLAPLGQQLLSLQFLAALQSVNYHPCLTVIAGYPAQYQAELDIRQPVWHAIDCSQISQLNWLGLDSSKRSTAQSPLFVVHSSAAFAERYAFVEPNSEALDLPAVGRQLLAIAAKSFLPWLDTPDWFQVHRWRYAIPQQAYSHACLIAPTALPLICGGDWCGNQQIASALDSGLAAAAAVNAQLQKTSTAEASFWQSLSHLSLG